MPSQVIKNIQIKLIFLWSGSITLFIFLANYATFATNTSIISQDYLEGTITERYAYIENLNLFSTIFFVFFLSIFIITLLFLVKNLWLEKHKKYIKVVFIAFSTLISTLLGYYLSFSLFVFFVFKKIIPKYIDPPIFIYIDYYVVTPLFLVLFFSILFWKIGDMIVHLERVKSVAELSKDIIQLKIEINKDIKKITKAQANTATDVNKKLDSILEIINTKL